MIPSQISVLTHGLFSKEQCSSIPETREVGTSILISISLLSIFFLFSSLWGMWDLSSPTRDWTDAPYIGRAQFSLLEHQGSPRIIFFFKREHIFKPAPLLYLLTSVLLSGPLLKVERGDNPCPPLTGYESVDRDPHASSFPRKHLHPSRLGFPTLPQWKASSPQHFAKGKGLRIDWVTCLRLSSRLGSLFPALCLPNLWQECITRPLGAVGVGGSEWLFQSMTAWKWLMCLWLPDWSNYLLFIFKGFWGNRPFLKSLLNVL